MQLFVNSPELMFLMSWANPVPLPTWVELKCRSQALGNAWGVLGRCKPWKEETFPGSYRPSQKATRIFRPRNFTIVFEHLNINVVFVLRLSVTSEGFGFGSRSCCGISTVFPRMILWGIDTDNPSLHPFLVPTKVPADRIDTEYKSCV